MKTPHLEILVSNWLGIRTNIVVPNVSYGLVSHECDILSMSKSGYLTEVELKVSKGDLMKDFKKLHAHDDPKIKYLYYAVPEELKEHALKVIPEHAGLLSTFKMRNGHHKVEAIKAPTARKNVKPLSAKDQFQMARLGAMRIWGLKQKLWNLKK